MEILTIIKESFLELFSTSKRFLISKKSYLFTFLFFILAFGFVFFLSKTLTQINFLEEIDLTDPNNVAQLQPLVDSQRRIGGIAALIVFFGIITTFIGKKQGFGSFLSVILSGFTIYFLIVPLILNGWNPVFVTTVFGGAVLVVSVFNSHGVNLKTITSITSGLLTLIVTLIIGEIFRSIIQVSGYYGESAYNLLVNTQRNFDMGGIVLSGIIMSGIGLLDDITLTQTSLTIELHKVNKKLKLIELYNKAMNVGRDHIGALVNSLFYAYAAASLPLLMLMNFGQVELTQILNYEFFMEEILRTLVASSGLILSVPLSTFIAALAIKKNLFKFDETKTESHSH